MGLTKYLSLLFAVLALFFTISSSGAAEKVDLSITKFSFRHNGMRRDHIYTYGAEKTPNGTLLTLSLWAGSKVTETVIKEPLLEELTELAAKYNLKKWDGFDRTNHEVMDGSGFQLSATYSDGTVIEAEGSNSFPNGYRDFKDSLHEIFNPLIDAYANLYPKKVESKELTSILVNYSGNYSFNKFIFALSLGDSGRKNTFSVEIDDKTGEFYPDGKFHLYGNVDDVSMEPFQRIIEKYNIASWNGHDAAAPDYADCEYYQLHFDYASGEAVSASGTVYLDGYKEFRRDILSAMFKFLKENKDKVKPYN